MAIQIVREEIFGPVVTITKFKTEEEVLELANDTTYGLAAAVHTKDNERSIRMTNALKAGTTWINSECDTLATSDVFLHLIAPKNMALVLEGHVVSN